MVLSGRLASSQSTESCRSQEAQSIGKVEVLGRGCNSSQKGIFVASRKSEGFSIHGTGIFTGPN